MYEQKINLIMLLPGRTIMSEQECFRKVRKPLIKNGKEIKNKKGEPIYKTCYEPVPGKTTGFKMNFVDKNDTVDSIWINTRNCKSARRHLNICKEAYENFISTFVPMSFAAPAGFKTPTITNGKEILPKYTVGTPIKTQAWLEMSTIERLEWHLKALCSDLGGILESYKILED